jgi:SpoVK/Ycf46/Vps4 family AAA+-type ATPase
MDNFEEIKVYKYILKYVKWLDSDKSKFLDLYKFITSKFKNININISSSDLTTATKIFKVQNKITKIIKKHLELQKYEETVLEKKFKLISEIYNLDNNEYEYLIYYFLKTINPIAKYIANDSSNEFVDFGNFFLDLPNWIINLKSKSLTNKGILLKQGFNTNKLLLNSKVLEILENTKIKTKTQIKKILLGENQKAELKWKDFEHIKKERDMVFNIIKSVNQQRAKGINILLYGFVGTGKTQFAKLIANKAKIDMFAVSSKSVGCEASRRDRLSDLTSKQTILSKVENSCILFDEAEDVMNRGFSEIGNASKAYLNTLLEETPVPVFWTTNNISNVDPAFLRRMTYAIEFKNLSDDVRFNIWENIIRKNKMEVEKDKLIELSTNYDIPPALISNAIKTTKLINGTQNDFEVFVENVTNVVLKKKNIKQKTNFQMNEYNENLVNADLDIKDLTSKIKKCGKLNFSLCLYGESGTGKSLYARHLAKEINVPVIFKRASDLKSKYVGETEQNIANAFLEAKENGAMLIFDEADSFLQTRNNSTKNWEISQVNEMLTCMENHEYPIVCTTNFMETIDEASLRRFTFKIKFDFLNNEQLSIAMEQFFGMKNADVNIKGLTAGDFATVKKKADFLEINNLEELLKMLKDEVKLKKSKAFKNAVGF